MSFYTLLRILSPRLGAPGDAVHQILAHSLPRDKCLIDQFVTKYTMAKIYHSPLKVEIPAQDVPSYIFSSSIPSLQRSPQYFDADNPARNFSLSQAEGLVSRVGKGLQNLRLLPDHKVLLYAGNSLYFPILFWAVLAAGCVFTGCTPGASVTGDSDICIEPIASMTNYIDQSWPINSKTRMPSYYSQVPNASPMLSKRRRK